MCDEKTEFSVKESGLCGPYRRRLWRDSYLESINRSLQKSSHQTLKCHLMRIKFWLWSIHLLLITRSLYLLGFAKKLKQFHFRSKTQFLKKSLEVKQTTIENVVKSTAVWSNSYPSVWKPPVVNILGLWPCQYIMRWRWSNSIDKQRGGGFDDKVWS